MNSLESMIDGFKVFEPLAASFRFSPPPKGQGWTKLKVVTELTFSEEAGGSQLPAMHLWYSDAVQPGMDAFIKKLGSWLVSLHMPSAHKLVLATVAAIAAKCSTRRALVTTLRELVSWRRTADVYHFAPLRTNLPSSWAGSLEWNGYVLGRLNLPILKSYIERAGSELPDAMRRMLDGCPAVASPPFKRHVFDLRSFYNDCRSPENAADLAQIEWNWFESAHGEHWDMMWADFEERRALIYALGYGLVEGDSYRKSPAIFEISCYLKVREEPKNEGGVVFHQLSLPQIVLPDLPETAAAIDALKSQCDLARLETSAIWPRIQSYAMTLNRGTRIGLEGHYSEGYLHFVIALEQLFSTGGVISQQVPARVAAISYRQLGVSFQSCRRTLQAEHYAARSKFVHNAVPVPINLFAFIHQVTQSVLRSLVWLSQKDEARSPDFFEQWMKRLDWIIAGFEAGIEPPAEVLDANGIIASDALTLP